MRSIAKRGIFCLLARTEKYFFGLGGGPFHRHKACIFVRAITKGLFGGEAAATPKIAFARFDIDTDGLRASGFGEV